MTTVITEKGIIEEKHLTKKEECLIPLISIGPLSLFTIDANALEKDENYQRRHYEK